MRKCSLRNVATAQWEFARLREDDDYVYVDKTDMLAKLAMREKDALYFIALVRVAERQIAAGDAEGLLGTLFGFYTKLPPTWTPENEADAKRYFLIFMEMAGARMRPETPAYRGYADAYRGRPPSRHARRRQVRSEAPEHRHPEVRRALIDQEVVK